MGYNPEIHHRRSIRLKGYDYSRKGAYFITINIKGHEWLLGKIIDKEMILNDAGIMINKWCQKIPEKFPDIELGVYQIMPNHFHAIVINHGTNVGANPCVRPQYPVQTDGAGNAVQTDVAGNAVQTDVAGIMNNNTEPILGEPESILGEHMGSPLHVVVQWFKTMSTNEHIRGVKSLGWKPFNGKLWQRDYYEHIIRDEKSYRAIDNYIINNPKNWKADKFYRV